MIWKRRHALFLVIALAVSVGAYWPGRWVSYATQVSLYGTLVTVAGIIFAVIGAWIALLSPKVLGTVLQRRPLGAMSEEEKRVRVLLHPMRVAAVVLAAAALFGHVAATINAVHPPDPWGYRILGASFSILVLLSQGVAWATLLTLLGPDYIESDLDRQYEHQDAVERLRSVG